MVFSSSTSSPGNGRAPGAGVTAVLGPTNTGKTHLAIERMLAHSSGIIGLPLRLLAREVYNKIADRAGVDSVALITGEEKIKPPRPRYWVSTVEAMPRDIDVSFLAVDEIQIAADLERGHVFTDRILHRRGRDETLLLGAATMRPIVERLLPGASIVTRPRLSQLEFAGDRKITRQPRRTAIVAFSADEVYAIAELIRRQHGGAAVVLGSLSPRTRNAQVAMFQSGDVDYLVATDAVGMGLNLDVDHVAFASDRKYDGYQFRRLTPSEFAQIAGRAGRATRDGTFGTTGRCAPFESELVNALQNHTFDSVKVLQWRNSNLDFSSLGALQVSLAMTPSQEGLTRAPIAEDLRVLDHAARDADVRDMAHGAAAVERLWDACQIPDYRKIAPAAHAELVTTLFGFLMRKGRVPDNWFAAQIAQADRIEPHRGALRRPGPPRVLRRIDRNRLHRLSWRQGQAGDARTRRQPGAGGIGIMRRWKLRGPRGGITRGMQHLVERIMPDQQRAGQRQRDQQDRKDDSDPFVDLEPQAAQHRAADVFDLVGDVHAGPMVRARPSGGADYGRRRSAE